MGKEIDMPKTMLIRKANDLIEARYKLTLAQQRLILYLNAQIKAWDKDFQYYKTPAIVLLLSLVRSPLLQEYYQSYRP